MVKKKVVVIGGGNGSAVVLNALKKFSDRLDISAVITMSDSGRSMGVVRREFNVPPPADVVRAALALSPYDYAVLRKIFYTNRCTKAPQLDAVFAGTSRPNLGSLFIAFLAAYESDYVSALRTLEEVVEAVGHVYPATLEMNDLCAELVNGTIIKTEAAIDRPTYDRSLKISRVWLEPNAVMYDGAGEVIEQADYIFLSPGSLYTSVVATLLPTGTKEAITQSPAQLIYVAGDAYELEGETGPERLSDFVEQLERYLPRKIDVVVYNNSMLTPAQQRKYAEKKWGTFMKDIENIKNKNIIGADFEKEEGGLSSEKLSKILVDLFNCHSE